MLEIHPLAPLQPDMWKKCLDCIDELLNILFENQNIFIGENIAEDSESLATSDQVVHCFFCDGRLFSANRIWPFQLDVAF